jgi:hypothetical protein
LVVFARSDDLFLGMLHSRIHEVWARAQGTQLRERESGLNYNIRSSFETFPFPWPPGNEPKDDPRVQEIAAAARELNELRENWLNPPEWTRTEVLEFPGTVGGPWDHYIINPRLPGADNLELADAEDATAIEYALAERAVELARRDATVRRPVRPGEVSTVHYPRIVPRDADCAKRLAARTLTNLYNQRPTWLEMAHRRLDSAVFAAYGWDPAMSDESILASLLELNRERSSGETSC